MGFLEALQSSAFGMWVAGGETIWAYPTILTLHTVGLAMVVGANTVIDLRLLGVASGLPLDELKKVYRPMWIGFIINLASGICLFVAAAENFGVMYNFYLKLTLIAVALIVAVRIRRFIPAHPETSAVHIPTQAKILAVISLVLWTAAIVTGRLMAYLNA